MLDITFNDSAFTAFTNLCRWHLLSLLKTRLRAEDRSCGATRPLPKQWTRSCYATVCLPCRHAYDSLLQLAGTEADHRMCTVVVKQTGTRSTLSHAADYPFPFEDKHSSSLTLLPLYRVHTVPPALHISHLGLLRQNSDKYCLASNVTYTFSA